MFKKIIRWQCSLWLTISLVTNAIIILGFCGFGIYTARQQAQLVQQEIVQITRAVTVNVSAAITNEIVEGRLANIEAFLLHQATVQHIDSILVTNAQGKVLSHVQTQFDESNQKKIVKPIYNNPKQFVLPNGSQEYFTPKKYSYSLEILRGARIGMVEVSGSLADLDLIRQQIYLDTMWASLIAACMSSLLIYFGLRQITKPLSRATDFAGALGTQRGTQLRIDSRISEVKKLLRALNDMSHDMGQQHALLKDSEVRKTAILQAALDCVITIDDKGNIIDFNPAAQACFGYTLDEVRGKEMADVIIPEHMRAAHRHGMARFKSTGESNVLGKRMELTAIRRSGEEFPVELAIIAFIGNGQRYFCGYLRDISMKKAMEAESAWSAKALMQIMREREYQKFALDQHSIVSICDAKGRITYANQKFTDISGYSSEQLLLETHALLKSGVHDAYFYREMWQTIVAGEVWHGQFANQRQDGGLYWVAATIVPWLDDDGHPTQYVAIQTDITAQKTIEHALEDSRQRELETGYAIQKSLLWGEIPADLGHTLIATYSEASQGVDGDFFGFTRFSDSCFEILVGDVMGKGVPAAMIGAAVKNCYSQILVQQLVQPTSSHTLPSTACIINALHQEMTERLISLNSFVTLALYRVDLQQQTIHYVNAGHTPAMLVSSKATPPFANTLANNKQPDLQTLPLQTLTGDNLPIGVMPAEVYHEHCVSFAPGAMLLAYSDGITETRDLLRTEFGDTRLAQCLQESHQVKLPPSQTLLRLRRELRQFAGNSKLLDDQTAVLVAFPSADSPSSEAFDMHWDLQALGMLRKKIYAFANAAGMQEENRDALILGCFESATNIIRHSNRPFADSSLSCKIKRLGKAIEVELLYVGSAFMPSTNPEPDFSGDSDGGFGLFIIEQAVEHVIYSTPLTGVGSIRLIQLLVAGEKVQKFPVCA